MLADGEIVGDGSWNLTIYVTDLNERRTMVVKGDMHIGGVMLKLTESFGKIFWSQHLPNLLLNSELLLRQTFCTFRYIYYRMSHLEKHYLCDRLLFTYSFLCLHTTLEAIVVKCERIIITILNYLLHRYYVDAPIR